MKKEIYKSIKVGNDININIQFRKNKNNISYVTNPIIENSSILLLDIYKQILYLENEFEKDIFKSGVYKTMSKTNKDIHYHNMMLERCKKLKKSDFDGSLNSYLYLLYLCANVLKHCNDIAITTELVNILSETLNESIAKVYSNIRTSLISNRNVLFTIPLSNCVKGMKTEDIQYEYRILVEQFLNLVRFLDYSKGAY